MDTSPIYIEMCRKATEIQELPEDWPIEHDWTGTFVPTASRDEYGRETAIWLPSQDELQAMVGLRVFDLQSLAKWARCVELQYETWEQFLLAYVMDTKYRKVWDDNEWKAS